MKNIFMMILWIMTLSIMIFPQQIKINITNYLEDRAELYSLLGEKTNFIDSISTQKNGTFIYNSENLPTGFYQFRINDKSPITFILAEEDVEIVTDADNLFDSLKVIKSESNNIYYEFAKLNKKYKTKTELLQLILARYPKDDDYYQITKEKLIRVQEDYLYFVNVTSQTNTNSFVARYVRSAQLPIIETDIPFDEQLTYLKTHSLENVNFYDDGLIYSDVFISKAIEYLTYYRNPQLPLELLEKEFIAAVDSILNKAKVNEIVYQHIVEYLINGFKKFGFDKIIDYIVENYVIKDDLCLDQKLGNTIERRIQQASNFKIGSIVPNIINQDSSGSLIELNKINSERTLVVFYASWCPHCQSLLPQIYDLYQDENINEFEVLAISIDTSRTDWLQFVKNNNLNWINVSDLLGWNGQAALDYFVYATPTMFLIDNDMKIIRMPKTIEELKKYLL